MIYSSIGYTKPQDGSYKGAFLPGGTYYCIIDMRDGQRVMSG